MQLLRFGYPVSPPLAFPCPPISRPPLIHPVLRSPSLSSLQPFPHDDAPRDSGIGVPPLFVFVFKLDWGVESLSPQIGSGRERPPAKDTKPCLKLQTPATRPWLWKCALATESPTALRNYEAVLVHSTNEAARCTEMPPPSHAQLAIKHQPSSKPMLASLHMHNWCLLQQAALSPSGISSCEPSATSINNTRIMA